MILSVKICSDAIFSVDLLMYFPAQVFVDLFSSPGFFVFLYFILDYRQICPSINLALLQPFLHQFVADDHSEAEAALCRS